MTVPRETIRAGAAQYGIHLSEEMLNQLERYGALLLEWNKKINLTAIVEPEAIAVKHFVDSLTLLSVLDIPQGAALLDVGTGAGFPAIPLMIVRPDLQLTVLDGTKKKLAFLEAVRQELGGSAKAIHMRAEEAGRLPAYREQFDVVTARAVANMCTLSEYCLPFVRLGGVFAAMKGPDATQELEDAGHAISCLGGRLDAVHPLRLPDQSGRTILLIQKISQTPPRYPRPSAQIAKKPL